MDIKIIKKYDDFTLDFSCKTDSKRIGILGASGCGKTLLLKSIAGIVKPDEGIIRLEEGTFYDSENGVNLKVQQRNVGYLFQNYALFPTMTVEQNIACGLGKKKDVEGAINRLIEQFGLKGLNKHYPSELSGGQQQRTALARMMAAEPKVLLFDEPFSAMDSCLRDRMRLKLKQLMDDFDGTSILVTHDRDEAYQLCDTLILMKHGRVVNIGKTKELFDNPKTLTTARLTGVKNISRAEKTGKFQVKALDWENILINTSQEVAEEVTHIGVRAHDIVFSEERFQENCYENQVTEVSEMPFEWQLLLSCGVFAKIDKSMKSHELRERHLPFFTIPPEALLLLTDEYLFLDKH